MIETEFVLGGFKAVFDCSAMTFDYGQLLDVRSPLWPSCKEGEVADDDLASD
jgi:hypothetical protein